MDRHFWVDGYFGLKMHPLWRKFQNIPHLIIAELAKVIEIRLKDEGI
jgi:hypothetical protein